MGMTIRYERLTVESIDHVIDELRQQARNMIRGGIKSCPLSDLARAESYRDLIESLLRPVRELVADLAECGGSQVMPNPVEQANIFEDDNGDSRIPGFRHCGSCKRYCRRRDGVCLICGSKKVAE